jgi:ankyrin repeat protein
VVNQVQGAKDNLTDDEQRLFIACWYGDLDTVHTLAALRLNLNVKDYIGRTPLHIAAAEDHFEIVKFLVA